MKCKGTGLALSAAHPKHHQRSPWKLSRATATWNRCPEIKGEDRLLAFICHLTKQQSKHSSEQQKAVFLFYQSLSIDNTYHKSVQGINQGQ